MKDDTISRQAAIDAFIRKTRPHDNGDGTITINIMSEGLIREVLTDLPAAEPRPRLSEEDKEVIRIHLGAVKEDLCNLRRWDEAREYQEIIDRLNGLPAAEPRRGKWILKPNIYGVAYCSECDYELHTNDTNYCPNCGAKMEESE